MTSTDRRRFNGRTPRGLTPEQRFWMKVRKTETCWLWTGSILNTGYGRFQEATDRGVSAHRWAYLNLVGPIPKGLHIDHLCRVRHCVNPAHLEPVTPLENVRRGIGHGRETHCPQGHEYRAENVYRRAGRRYCRACQSAYLHEWRSMTPAQREARKAAGLPVVDLSAIFATQLRRAA